MNQSLEKMFGYRSDELINHYVKQYPTFSATRFIQDDRSNSNGSGSSSQSPCLGSGCIMHKQGDARYPAIITRFLSAPHLSFRIWWIDGSSNQRVAEMLCRLITDQHLTPVYYLHMVQM
jgi:hypothetical protein